MDDVRYTPGDTPLIAVPGAVALLGSDDLSVAGDVWRRLGEGAGLAGVLDALTGAFGASLSTFPPFAVAVAEAGAVRVAVRGAVDVVVHAAGTDVAVTGRGVTTWTEQLVAGAEGVSVTVGDTSAAVSDAVALPLRDGVARARAVKVRWGAAPAVREPAPVAEDAALLAGLPAPAVEETAAVAEAPATTRLDAAPEVDVPAPSVVEMPAPPAEEPTPPAEQPVPPPAALIDSSAVLTVSAMETLLPQADDPADYDQLWGATQLRSVEAAAVRVDEEEDDAAPAASDPAPAASSAPTDAPATRGDHDGETMSLEQARALRASGLGAVPSDGLGPLAPPRMPAPGRVRLSTGQTVVLDRTIVIGRRPRSTRVSGTDLPHLVAVPSPQQDISRSHLELRVEGDSILACDLDTTNGTTLHRPGAEPVRLHPGERTIVVAGDVLDLGDGVTCTVEALS